MKYILKVIALCSFVFLCLIGMICSIIATVFKRTKEFCIFAADDIRCDFNDCVNLYKSNKAIEYGAFWLVCPIIWLIGKKNANAFTQFVIRKTKCNKISNNEIDEIIRKEINNED